MMHVLTRRNAVLAAPAVVPLSMATLFALLSRSPDQRRAYTIGFAAYLLGWCTAFPAWVLGPRRCLGVLTRGRDRGPGGVALLLLPVAGAIGTELWPNRRQIDRDVAMVMVSSAMVNAIGEELLWRGVFLEVFADDVLRGAVWPSLGFVIWHLAPQIILPSRRGRVQFLLASAVVGATTSVVAWRSKGLRWTLIPHIATDACGVRVAQFRLGG